jgi:putative flavoprotein involved in K+ transport
VGTQNLREKQSIEVDAGLGAPTSSERCRRLQRQNEYAGSAPAERGFTGRCEACDVPLGPRRCSAVSRAETNLLAASALAYVVFWPILMQVKARRQICFWHRDMEQRMPIENIDTLVVGGGQAGLAMSQHLSANGVPHLIVERGRIAERWRSERWDSLVANGPAWHDRFPGLQFSDVDPSVGPNDFPPKEIVADYFVAFANKISAPIRCGVDVLSVESKSGRPGFHVETSAGPIEANSVVAATGAFQRPIMPAMVPSDGAVVQMHSAAYRNPGQLPDGAVLVVGSGSSGTQIAEELLESGRRVYLSVGPHDRPPRAYRGRDYCWWLGVLGKWDAVAREAGKEHVTIAVSGTHGGHTIDFRRLAAQGMILLGRTEAYENGVISFAPDLIDNLAKGDWNLLSVFDEADAYVVRNGLALPEEPAARATVEDAECVTNPILSLDLAKSGIATIIWATGFTSDFGWLKVDAFDEHGRPKHQRGVSAEPGIYFLGLPWQSRRGSSFIWGVWHDAKYLADQITIQRNYMAYHRACSSE